MKKLLLFACLIAGIAVASCDTPKETTETKTNSTDSVKVQADTTTAAADTTKKP